tara:strand:- start:219 stop:395 length:177 start_codon:yes stop_codon:yes gene_type:complete
MKTKTITIDGVEYTLSSSTNLGLQNAIIQLKNSLGKQEVGKTRKVKVKKTKKNKEDGI